MKYNNITRRMFLQGSSKTMLMIPFLGSLVSRTASAQSTNIDPRFIFISAQNGGQRHEQWYPGSPTTSYSMYPAFGSQPTHNYHLNPIQFSVADGVSPIFDNKFNRFVPKMNFIKGLDQRFSPFGNHEGAALLGNVRASHSSMSHCPMIPTIDQLMAYSPNFYPNNGNGYVRSLVLNSSGSVRHTSYTFANPYKSTGDITKVPSLSDPRAVFRALFEGTNATTAFGPNVSYVDKVLEDFNRVKRDRNLASSEKHQLEDYMDQLSELQKKLSANVIPDTPSCKNLSAPTSMSFSSATQEQQVNLITDMMVIAFQCERTRVATFHFNHANGIGEGSSHTKGSWHWSSHNSTDPLGAEVLLNTYKWIADKALYVLLDKMDAITEANGKTMLDNSLVHFATSSAHTAHNHQNLPTLLFGSAGGFFKTGNNVDYVNRNAPSSYGILHNQYLVNVMTAMGLDPESWNMKKLGFSRSGYPESAEGYGWYYDFKGADKKYTMSENNITEPLPGLVTASGLTRFG